MAMDAAFNVRETPNGKIGSFGKLGLSQPSGAAQGAQSVPKVLIRRPELAGRPVGVSHRARSAAPQGHQR